MEQLQENQVSLTQTQAKRDTNEAQTIVKLLKKEKALPPAEDYLESVRDLRRCIPNLESCTDDVRDYYKLVLQSVQSLHETALNSELKTNEVENNLGSLLKQLSSLYAMLADYKKISYQQKFNADQFKDVLKSLQGYTQCLKKNQEDLSALKRCLDLIMFDNDPIKHLGQELSQEDFQKYRKTNKFEEERLKCFDRISKQLEVINKKLHDHELKSLESKQKIQELEKSRAKSMQALREREDLIRKKEENVLFYAEKIEDLEFDVEREITSKMLNIESKGERQQEKVIERHNQFSEKRDEIRSTLLGQLLENSTMNPWKHYIFLLDQSGSMKGSRWNALTKAVGTFVEKNKNQVSDLLSVITFDDTPTEVFKKIKFSEYQTPPDSKWGGTSFDPAFKMALEISNLSRTHRPIVVFLTDGEGRKKEAPKILREMSTLHKNKGFIFFSIGVGEDYNSESLKEITRTANNGKLFIDLGNQRIEFLQTTRDERVLEKVFGEIADAINTLEDNIKSAIKTLDKERNEAEEETQRQYAFNARMTEQGRQEVSRRQEERLERERTILERRKEEEQNQVHFFKTEIGSIQKEIERLDDELKKQSREVVAENIEGLLHQKHNLEMEKNSILEEKQQLSADRTKLIKDLHVSVGSRNMSTSFQLFDFLRAKEKVKTLKDDRRKYLGKILSFLNLIIKESETVETCLLNSKIKLSDLEEDAVFDIVVQYYQESVSMEKDRDAPNFRRIACHILEINENEKNTNELKILELLTNCLAPRIFVCPKTSNEQREASLVAYLKGKNEADANFFDEQLKFFEDASKSRKEELEVLKGELNLMEKELQALEKKQSIQEQDVKNLKTQINKTKRKDETDKENIQTKMNTEEADDDDDDDDDNESEKKLQKAKKLLVETEKTIEDQQKRKNLLEKDIRTMEDKLRKTRSKRFEVEEEKLEKLKGKDQMKYKIFEYHDRLKIELMARVNKYLKDTSRQKLSTFEKNLMVNLITPLNDYFSSRY